MLDELFDPGWQLFWRPHHVGQPLVDGAARHRVEARRGRVLHEGGPRLPPNGPEPQRAVRAHAREENANAALATVVGQRAEEEVDREPQPPPCGGHEKVEDAIDDRQVPVRRDHVDVAGLHTRTLLRLDDGEGRHAGEQPRQQALVRRIHVLNDHEGRTALWWHVLQESPERLEAPRRRADAHDRK